MFYNPDFPTSIDVKLTTSYRSFHNSCAIETGLSDFHKMIASVMKTHFQKQEPKIIQYRDYSNFSAEEYRQYILSLLSSQVITRSSFGTFMIRKDACDIRVAIKCKYLISSQSPLVNKNISKAIMNQTRLRNRFSRTRSNGDKEAYNKQRDYYRKIVNKNHFGNKSNLLFPIKTLTFIR